MADAPVPDDRLRGRHLVVGVTGSIAAYKAAELVRLLVRAGAEVQPLMTRSATRFIPALTLSTLAKREALVELFPEGAADVCAHASDLFINTMWERDRLPRSWTEPLNRARAVIVPTRYVAEVCRQSDVVVPIEVVPEGVDPGLYPYLERPERDGDRGGRQDVGEGLDAERDDGGGGDDEQAGDQGGEEAFDLRARAGPFDPIEVRRELVSGNR